MKNIYSLAIILVLIFNFSCRSVNVLEGKRNLKLYDEWLVLKDNGKYKTYMVWVGLKIGVNTGHYIISSDTAYLISKRKDDNYRLNGYIFIDTLHRGLLLQYMDSASPREYSLYKDQRK